MPRTEEAASPEWRFAWQTTAIAADDLDAGLGWLAHAIFHGARGSARVWRARTLMALDRPEQAVEAWSATLADDPEDLESYLGRARTMRRLGHWENALADLEQAAERAADLIRSSS